MSEELMPLEDIETYKGILRADGYPEDGHFMQLANTARAAHRLQGEIERLKKENASLQAMYDLGVSFHKVKCAELNLAFHKMDKLEAENEELKHDIDHHLTICSELATENEELRKDAERLDYLLSSSNLVVRCDIPSNEGWRVMSRPNNYLTGWHETEREAIDAAMKNGGDGE